MQVAKQGSHFGGLVRAPVLQHGLDEKAFSLLGISVSLHQSVLDLPFSPSLTIKRAMPIMNQRRQQEGCLAIQGTMIRLYL